MSYVICRESPNALNPEARKLWVWKTKGAEAVYTPDKTQAMQFYKMTIAMAFRDLYKSLDDIEGVTYTVVEV